MPKVPKPLSWKARRNGEIYCSPACGSNCTRASYEQALKLAAALCKELGPSWVPRVWENMGWHCQASSSCGRWHVHISKAPLGTPSYTVFLSPQPSQGGKWVAHGKTPQAALRKVWKSAKPYLEDCSRLLGSGIP